MDIAMVFDGLQVGGIERVGASYARLLLEQGHTVTIVNLRPELTAMEREYPSECPLMRVAFPQYRAPDSRANMIRCGYWEKLTYPVRYTAAAVRNAVQRPLLRMRSPLLQKTYDLAIAFSGHFNDLCFVADGFVRAKQCACWLHGALYQYIITSSGYLPLYRRIGNLICLSETGDVECADLIGRNGLRKRKLYNPCVVSTAGVDQEKVTELRERFGDFCLMVGRLAGDKDQETVIRAMRCLRDEYGLRKKLLLVGDGWKREALETLAAELDMSDDVIFTGSRSDVQNYYSAAHVYVHAAPQEGLPTVFLEAMAFGLPIASTDAVPGTRELLGNSEYGLISPNAAPSALAENIRRLYEDEELRTRLIQAGTVRLRDFAPETISAQLAGLLTDITERDGRGNAPWNRKN